MKKILVIIGYIFLFLLTIYGIDSNKFMLENNDKLFEIRGLKLKCVLIDTPYEIYRNFVEKKEEEYFYKSDKQLYNYYLWMKDAYKNLSIEDKKNLKNIYDNNNFLYLLNITSRLKDDATINDILDILISDYSIKNKDSINKFYKIFYEQYLKDYIDTKKAYYETICKNINDFMDSNKIDLLGFMEKTSGLKFYIKYNIIEYITFRRGGIYPFVHGELNLITVGNWVNNYQDAIISVFHELSHDLFLNFTDNYDYFEAKKRISKNRKILNVWSNYKFFYKYQEDFCEEMLVEGFAKFLKYKYFGKNFEETNDYLFDNDFCKYLKKIKFDHAKITLEKACIEFLNQYNF